MRRRQHGAARGGGARAQRTLLLQEGGAEVKVAGVLRERAHDAVLWIELHPNAAALRRAAALQPLRDGGLLAASEAGGGPRRL